MRVSLESTTKIVTINGVEARIWEGITDSGIPVHAFISRIATRASYDQTKFKAELDECREPYDQAIKAYPARLVL